MATEEGLRNGVDLDPQRFVSTVKGPVFWPGDEGYEQSRKIFNAMIDRRPWAIVKVAGTADVVSCVNYAREKNLPLSIRGGGHNVSGNAICDDGIVIDFSGMRTVRVDPKRMVAYASPGATWGDFDHETQLFGLATPGGLNSTTGVAGFTLGGGIGWLMSKYGLTCDNLVSADVVTADGEALVASEEENPDLFWGIRGGGGNFGVVTSFELRLHPVSTVLCGPVVHPVESSGKVLRFFRKFTQGIPGDLTTGCLFRPTNDGKQVVGISAFFPGTPKDGEKTVEPLRKFGPPIIDGISPRPYEVWQKFLDDIWPHGLYCYWKSGYIKSLSEEAIDAIARHAINKPSPLSVIALVLQHGAVSRVQPEATAFNHREDLYNLNIQAQWRDPRETEANMAWIRDFWASVEPYMTGRVYVNFLSQETSERVRAAYGTNYDRMVALKNKYDPGNLFRFNQNIKPSVTMAR